MYKTQTNLSNDTKKNYLSEIKKYPPLEPEETLRLIESYQQNHDQEALDKLTKHYQNLLVWIVRKYSIFCGSYTFMDLIVEANVALIKAINDFDINLEVNFTTYSIKCIHRHLKRAIEKNGEIFHIPRDIMTGIKKYDYFINKYFAENGKYPTEIELCNYLEVSPKRLEELLMANEYIYHMDTLDRPSMYDEKSEILVNTIESSDTQLTDFENNLSDRSLCVKLKELLPSYYYFILYHYILSENRLSQGEIADIVGVESAVISGLFRKIKDKIVSSGVINKKTNLSLKEISNYDIRPVDFKKKVILLFLKEQISDDEFDFIYNIWYLGVTPKKYQTENNLSEKQLAELFDNMKKSYKILFPSEQSYSNILNSIKVNFSNREICNIDILSMNIPKNEKTSKRKLA